MIFLILRMNTQAKLSLLGAGPGDPELISLKGIKALQTADVILYDALVNEQLLDWAPAHCLRIFVGKRAGRHEKQQEEINRMIVGYAQAKGHVVRLKGGDPFVFGRGAEERDFAKAYGIKVEYIPGISSSIAVPGLADIPLTQRGMSESFTVVTGTLRNGEISPDLKHAASGQSTLVILMGLKKLDKIVEIVGKSRGGSEGIALIQQGSTSGQRVLVGNLGNIVSLQHSAQIQSPVLIIIGSVVRNRHFEQQIWEDFSHFIYAQV